MTQTLLIIAIGGPLAGLLAIGTVRAGFRLRRSARSVRQAPQEPAHSPATTPWSVPLRLVSHLVNRRQPTPTPAHQGATEGFGQELAQMNEQLHTENLPLDSVEADWHQALNDYETRTSSLYQACAGRLDWILTKYAADNKIEIPKAEPVASIEVALLRLRLGVLEPVETPRSVQADTGRHDFTGLRALLDAEDRTLVAAR